MPLGAFSAIFLGPYWCIRPSTIGTFPPAWVKIKRMFLNCANVPVNRRLVTARVVSCGTSVTRGETSGNNVRQHIGVVGCTNTMLAGKIRRIFVAWSAPAVATGQEPLFDSPSRFTP